ncbi:hypothetical protein ACKLTP_05910 [Paenarthrobacter ureafaciens]|jgi:hypothetical protein|uniref:hypothetical protein n=1 Tax=Paenarthrobacter TaxID=1742992 RepID=UPI00140BD754|nr:MULTISPECIES: hypothetical protein [Paenarthrobacter]MCW3767666.1 hypothetical protein [Paenarthrobacter sp. PAE-2]MCX8454194.1 hypothetical protein [Paenarthrobacter ureafaciens]MCY0972400.1 hypothetical protein [Paenarthrobacter ureafaciens]
MPLQSKAFQRWLHNVAPDASTADVCRVSGIKRTTLAQQLVRGKVAESTLVSISRAYGLNPVQELATFDLYAVLHGNPVPPTPAELVSQIATIDLLRAVVQRSEPGQAAPPGLSGTPHPTAVRNWVDAIDDGELRHRVSEATGIAPQNFSAHLTANRLPPELAIATSRAAGVGPAGGLVAGGLITEAEAGWPAEGRQDALDRMTLGELVTLAGERLQALGKTLRRQEQDHERTERIWENLG